jgi:hypothetical protein
MPWPWLGSIIIGQSSTSRWFRVKKSAVRRMEKIVVHEHRLSRRLLIRHDFLSVRSRNRERSRDSLLRLSEEIVKKLLHIIILMM